VLALKTALLEHECLDATVWSHWDDYPEAMENVPNVQAVAALGNAEELYHFRSSTAERRPCVSKERGAKTTELLADNPWDDITFVNGSYRTNLPLGYFSPQDTAVEMWSPYVSCNGVPEVTPMFELSKDMRTLSVEVWAKRWDVHVDVQALVEEACVEVGLERIFGDIEEWTSVESDDPTRPKTLKISAEAVEYEVQDGCA